MKKFSFIIFAAGLLVAASCSKTDIAVEENPTWQLTMTGGAKGTKTSIGTPDGEGNVPFIWKSGDKLGIFVSTGGTLTANKNIYALVQKEEGKGAGFGVGDFKASLTGLAANTDYSVKIYYPYDSNAGSDGSVIAHAIPSIQTQQGGGISEHLGLSGGFGYATAEFTTPADITDYAPGLTFTLTQKTAVIWLNMKAADSGLNGWVVRSVKISAPEGTYLAGNTAFNTSSGSFTLSGNGSNAVTVNIPGGAALATGTSIGAYAVVFPAVVDGKNLVFTYTLESPDAGETKVVSHTRSISEGLGAFEPASVNRFTEAIPSSNASGWVYGASRIDLSAGGTSNCYIVSTPGEYSLNATVIGNGQEGILTNMISWNAISAFHTSSASITPTSAELIWQTTPGLISNVSLAGGRLTFDKPDGKEGNALVAVKDAGGAIIWSWHIWCTDMPKVQKYETYRTATFTSSSTTYNSMLPGFCYMVMDRNLGATLGATTLLTEQSEIDQTIGLYYQGGRKDPFVGHKTIVKNNTAFATLYDAAGDEYTRPATVADTENTNVAYSIANPATFITGNYWYNSANWRAGANYWGFQSYSTNGYAVSATASPSTNKSIYDPCPPGYCVPTFNVWAALSGTASDNSSNDGGVLLSASDGAFNTWYPHSGFIALDSGGAIRESNNSNYIGTYGYYWNNTRCWGNVNVAGSNYVSTRVNLTNSNQMRPCFGFSVRCMQEY